MPLVNDGLFVAGITLSALTSGGLLSLTFLGVPSTLAAAHHPSIPSPSSSLGDYKTSRDDDRAPREINLMLTQWRYTYHVGRVVGPTLFVSAAAACFGNAWTVYDPDNMQRTYLFVAAAVANLFTGPFTALTMLGVNMELHRREEAGRGVKGDWTTSDPNRKLKADGSSESLLKKWSLLNGIRAMFPLASIFLVHLAR